MASVTASIAARPLGTGRAILLIAASVLLHAIFLAAMRDQLAMPSFEPEPATRTIETSLIVEARPAPAAPKPVRKVAPRRPRPAPPPPVEPQTIAAPEPAPVPVAPADEPLPAAPGESDTQIGAVEFAQPVAPPADPARVEERPAETQPAPPGVDLAAELSEVGSAADALPASASYVFRTRDTRYSALTGTTILEWKVDDARERYEMRLHSTVFGIKLADISSSGAIRRFGLAPERYVQKTGTRAPVAANVDWERGIVTYSSKTYQRPARAGIQDRLSFQFQLMALGQLLPKLFQAGATVSIDVTGPSDIESYHFLVVGNEAVETEGGPPIETIKLDRVQTGPNEARIEVWLAPSHRYLPVRIRFTDRRGNVTENVLESAHEGG